MTLRLTGSSHGEIEPRKATYQAAGRNTKTPTILGQNSQKRNIPAALFSLEAARVKGTQWLKWLHLKERNNLTKGTNKNTLEVLGKGRTLCRLDEQRKSSMWVGCGVIAARRSEYTIMSREWLDTAQQLVNFGRNYPGRNSGVIYFAYKCECIKLFERETGGKLSLFKS